MAEAAKRPVRITKQRAHALILAADRGIDEQIEELRRDYGVKLYRDGSREVDESHFGLFSPGDLEKIEPIVEGIMRAIETLSIFDRRYG